jgi:peroxiredoxin
MSVPDVAVTDVSGASVSLSSLAQKPTVLIFYRGGWCPFCNVQLGQLQAIEADIRAAGFDVVAISPDDAAGLQKSASEHTLSYRLMSDTPVRAASAFGVAFHVDGGMGLALRAVAPQHEALPVPAVFVLDKGVVRFAYANPNYKVRLAPELLMAALTSTPKTEG